jgi:O-antigen/teichoic acid export membrane protein
VVVTPGTRSIGVGQAVALTSGAAMLNMTFLFLETTLAARLVSTDAYGVYVLIVAVVNFVMMVVDLGSKTAVTQLIARGDAPSRSALVNTALLFRLGLVGVVGLIIWLPRDLLPLVEPGYVLRPYVDQLPAMILVASFDQLLFGMLQGFQAYRSLAIAQTLRSVLRLALTAVFLGPLALGISGLVYSWTLSFGISALYQYFALPVGKNLRFARASLNELIRFGAPLQMSGFLWFVFTRIQTFVLGAFGGPSAVALFAVASRIPEAAQQVAESYMAVYFPKMTALLASGRHAQARMMFEASLRLVSFGAALLALGCVSLSTEITEFIFSSRYAVSAPAFAVLMVALHMVLVVNLMGYTLTSAGHPRRSLVVDVIRTSVVLGASLALVAPFGFLGAACARLLSSYSGAPVVVWLLRRDLPVDAGGLLKSTCILLVCAPLAALTQPAGALVRIAVAIVFLALNVGAGAIRLDDLRLLVPVLHTRRTTSTVAGVGESA